MITNRDDDYLICKHYYNNIDKLSKDYKDFITFEHNDNHYFAWVHDGKVILRSEAYPDYERTVRGIKAIIKNRDIEDRYSIDSQHGVHFLCLWGGGKNNKHTGNMGEHNEIGRSCPAKTKEALYNLIAFKGNKFASAVTGYNKGVASSSGGKKVAAATGAIAAASLASKPAPKTESANTKTAAVASVANDEGGGFRWWWLLLPLLLLGAFFLFKGCDGEKAVKAESVKVETEKVIPPIKEEVEVKTDLEDKVEVKRDDAAIKAKADEDARAKLAAEKARADAKAKAAADAAKAKADAERKARTGGSVTQENIKIGNKNSGF